MIDFKRIRYSTQQTRKNLRHITEKKDSFEILFELFLRAEEDRTNA